MRPAGGERIELGPRNTKVTKTQIKRKLLPLLKVRRNSIKDDAATFLIMEHFGLEIVLRMKKKIKPLWEWKTKKRIRDNERNWLELPKDVMLLIFTKLNVFDLLLNAQMVCSSWLKLSKEPSLFRSIDIRNTPHCFKKKSFSKFAKEAMHRSCGQMVRFSCGPAFLTNKIIEYVSSHFHSLKYLELQTALYVDITEVLADNAGKLCQLEELHLHYAQYYQAIRMMEEIGSSCPNLKCFQLDFTARKNEFIGQDESFVIARYMPHLRRLLLINSTLTNEVLIAIIQGCPLLEHIFLRGCVNINLPLDEGRIRQVQILNEANHEYEFVLTSCDVRYPISKSKYQTLVETEGYINLDGCWTFDKSCPDYWTGKRSRPCDLVELE